jgi:hypothetical protein
MMSFFSLRYAIYAASKLKFYSIAHVVFYKKKSKL